MKVHGHRLGEERMCAMSGQQASSDLLVSPANDALGECTRSIIPRSRHPFAASFDA